MGGEPVSARLAAVRGQLECLFWQAAVRGIAAMAVTAWLVCLTGPHGQPQRLAGAAVISVFGAAARVGLRGAYRERP